MTKVSICTDNGHDWAKIKRINLDKNQHHDR